MGIWQHTFSYTIAKLCCELFFIPLFKKRGLRIFPYRPFVTYLWRFYKSSWQCESLSGSSKSSYVYTVGGDILFLNSLFSLYEWFICYYFLHKPTIQSFQRYTSQYLTDYSAIDWATGTLHGSLRFLLVTTFCCINRLLFLTLYVLLFNQLMCIRINNWIY